MHEQANARLIHTYTRDFFRGSLKTSNKFFNYSHGNASSQRKMARNQHSDRARYIINNRLRPPGLSRLDSINRLFSCSRDMRAGNCGEYVDIGLYFGVTSMIPNIWLGEHDLHAFLLIADLNAEDGLVLSLNGFVNYEDTQIHEKYISDPWFNIVCPMHLYHTLIQIKSAQWALEGKEILQDRTRLTAGNWANRLFAGEIQLARMTDRNGNPTETYDGYMRKNDNLSSSDSE